MSKSVAKKQKQDILLEYLSKMFPTEFFVYFETMKFKNLSAEKNLNDQNHDFLGISENYFLKLKNSEKIFKKIEKRRKMRVLIISSRKKRNSEEDKFMEACKRIKVFHGFSREKLLFSVNQLSGLEFSVFSFKKLTLQFLEYALTICIKL